MCSQKKQRKERIERYDDRAQKDNKLVQLLKGGAGKTIIFCQRRNECTRLAEVQRIP